MTAIRMLYEGLHGEVEVILYDPEPVESKLFGTCFEAYYGIPTKSGSIAQVAEPGMFRLDRASLIEPVEITEPLPGFNLDIDLAAAA